VPVMAGSPPESGAIMRREALDHCHSSE
jgi:hypothetical protein